MIVLGSGNATSTASPGAFFSRWVDHDGWPQWSPDTEWVRLDGPVQLGARGVLKPKGGPKVKFFISALSEDHQYADTSVFPGARLIFDHTAIHDGDRTELRAQVTLTGALARVWALILDKGFKDSVQADLDRLVRIVESGQ